MIKDNRGRRRLTRWRYDPPETKTRDTEPFSSSRFAGLKDVYGLGQIRPDPPGAMVRILRQFRPLQRLKLTKDARAPDASAQRDGRGAARASRDAGRRSAMRCGSTPDLITAYGQGSRDQHEKRSLPNRGRGPGKLSRNCRQAEYATGCQISSGNLPGYRSRTLSCRVPRFWVGQPGWRPVTVVAGGAARARVSARRSASGSRYRPAMRRTRSAASAGGIPAAVTNNGRAEDPRWTGAAWVTVRNLDFATPITGMPNSACACAPRPGRPPGSRSA